MMSNSRGNDDRKDNGFGKPMDLGNDAFYENKPGANQNKRKISRDYRSGRKKFKTSNSAALNMPASFFESKLDTSQHNALRLEDLKRQEQKKQLAAQVDQKDLVNDQVELLTESSHLKNLPAAILQHIIFQTMNRGQITTLLTDETLDDGLRNIIILDDIIRLRDRVSELKIADKENFIARCNSIIESEKTEPNFELIQSSFHTLFNEVREQLIGFVDPKQKNYADLLTFFFLDNDIGSVAHFIKRNMSEKTNDFDPVAPILSLNKVYKLYDSPAQLLKTLLLEYRHQVKQKRNYPRNLINLINTALTKLKSYKFHEAYDMLRMPAQILKETKPENGQSLTLKKIIQLFQDPQTEQLYGFYQHLDQNEALGSDLLDDADEYNNSGQQLMDELSHTQLSADDQDWGDEENENNAEEWNENEADDFWKEPAAATLFGKDIPGIHKFFTRDPLVELVNEYCTENQPAENQSKLA